MPYIIFLIFSFKLNSTMANLAQAKCYHLNVDNTWKVWESIFYTSSQAGWQLIKSLVWIKDREN